MPQMSGKKEQPAPMVRAVRHLKAGCLKHARHQLFSSLSPDARHEPGCPCRIPASLADFPVRRVIGAHHFLADLTLPYGRVVHDYNKEADDLAEAAE
jgi:hypothetical protein